MGILLSDAIQAVRDRHPAFVRQVVPDKALATYWSMYQNRLIAAAQLKAPGYLVQSMSIVLDPTAANDPSVAGAGSAGGLPGSVSNAGVFSTEAQTSGTLETIDTENVPVLVTGAVPTSSASLTLTLSTATWTVNAYANKAVVIVQGPGFGQRRRIASNTATTLTLTQAWVTLPTTESVFNIVTDSTEADLTFGAITDLNANPTTTRVGYLVRLTAAGVPYLDLTQPLTATLATGVPLPPNIAIIGATGYTAQTVWPNMPVPIDLVEYGSRTRRTGRPSAYVLGNTLYTLPDPNGWQGITSVDLRYVPVAPTLAARTDYFLLPDEAYDALVAKGAAQAAMICSAYSDLKAAVNATALMQDADTAEITFLETVAGKVPPTVFQTREVY